MKRTWLCLFIAASVCCVAACDDDEGGGPTNRVVCGDGEEEGEEECDDGNDIDGDGCSATCTAEEVCGDNRDNDSNGQADCDDPACASDPDCGEVEDEDCDTVGDEDDDGDADCDDSDCADEPACEEPAEEDCDATGDEDGDGDADCDDSDCASEPECEEPTEEDCETEGDEDGDGDADCDDTDCVDDPACEETPEDCATEGDEDGDGDADCDDTDCAEDPACEETPVEDCETVGDEDDNGDADCADEACADLPVCLCGNEIVDEGEDCDEALLNNDDAPNTCREDCTFPSCGDGVVDDDNPYGEEDAVCAADVACDEICDGGDNCTSDCSLTTFAGACGEDVPLIELVEGDLIEGGGPNDYRIVRGLDGSAGGFAFPVDCNIDAEAVSGAEAIVVFVPTVGGQFLARTDFPATEVDTVLYARTPECEVGGAVCNDDTAVSFGSSIIFDASAGAPVFLFVDSFSGDFGDFTLEIRGLTQGGDGDSCAAANVLCEEDLACVNDDGTELCETAEAPTLIAVSARITPDTTQIVFSAEGVDANHDIAGFVGVITDDEEVLEDIPLGFDFGTVVYDDADGYLATAVFGTDAAEFAGYDTITGSAVDSVDLESDELSGDVIFQEEVLVDGECDGVTTVCPAGSACLANDAAPNTCQTSVNAPVIVDLELRWVAPNQITFIVTGTDADADGWGIRIEWLDAFGDPFFDEPDVFNFNNDVTGLTEFEGRVGIFFPDPALFAEDLQDVSVEILDASGNASAPVEEDIPWPTISAAGSPCDEGQEEFLCQFGRICDNFEGDLGECRLMRFHLDDCIFLPEDPATGEPGLYFLYESPPTDDGGSGGETFLYNIYQGPNYRTTDGLIFGDALRDEYGKVLLAVSYPADGFPLATLIDGDTHFDCHVITFDGEDSNHVREAIPAELGAGIECDPDTDVCFNEFACLPEGDIDVCQAGTAPTIDSATLERVSLTEMTITVNVSDPDGDLANAYHIGWLFPSGQHLIVPPYLFPVENPDASGEVTLEFVVDPTLPIIDGITPEELWHDFVESVIIEVFDESGLSDSVVVPVNIAAGESCSAEVDAIPCVATATCELGFCTE